MDTGPKQRRRMNPRYKANLLSILTFGWTIETFKMGYNRDITDSDLYAVLPEHQSNVLGDAIEKAWNKEVQACNYPHGNKKPSLNKVIIKVFGAELMINGLIVAAMEFLIRLLQPLFLGLLLRYYNARVPLDSSRSREKPVNGTYVYRIMHYYDMEGGVTWGEAVFFSFGIVFCSMANVMVQHPFMMGGMHIGMKIRVGVCSLIYRKALRVSSQAMSEASAGLVVNLMANDVNRFDNGPIFLHYLWIGPVETIIMTAYLYRLMGSPAIYSSFVIFAVVPFQIFLGTRTAYYRMQTAIKSDERVRLMKEIIMGIEVIKMYTWENPFRKIIDYARREEIFYIKRTSYIRGIIMSFIMFTSRFGIFLATLFYVSYYNKVTAETVFFLTCYYNIMKQTMTLYFPQAVGQVAEMLVAIRRIRDYLLSEECSFPSREVEGPRESEEVHDSRKRVTISTEPPILVRGAASMNDESGSSSDYRPIIKDKRIDVSAKQVSILFENASSGWIKSKPHDVKDITLQIMLGSLTTIIGAVGSGKSTILHMILSELPCSTGSIKKDGILSYASQEPWLFVGSVRQNILFGQPFNKYRYMEVCKVCALERDISLFPHGDKTIVGERGVSLSGGQRARINLARAVYKIADIYLLDDPLSAVDTQVAKHIFEKCLKRYLGNKTVILVTHQLQFIKFVDHIVVLENGKILAEGDYHYINSKKLPIIRLMEDNAREVKEEEASTHTAAVPPRIPSMIQQSTGSLYRSLWAMMLDSDALDEKPEAEAQALGRVGGFIYKEYFLAGGIYPYVLLVGFMFVFAQACCSSGDYWISRWSNVEEQLTGDDTIDNIIWQEYGLQRHHFTMIFTLITACTVCFSLLRSFLFFNLCMKSSINMHDEMFESVSRSPMSFFHVNPSGRILNRFSKDMGAVDELLPQAMLDCFQITLNLMGVLVVILLIDITLIIPTATSIIVFYILRVIYIRTTGAVKRLEGITRSPVFSHLNATVLGLATIRSFGAETLLIEEFDRHQDLHSAAWYLFISCSRAFGYFLDVICLLFIICVTFSFLMKSDVEGSKVGLAITQSISLTGVFQWGMRQSAEMENQMTSVERVLEYTNLTQEDCLRKDGMKKKLENWPTNGEIEFRNVYMKYAPDGDYVLQKLNFIVFPRQKIGIVGRTGAGKSSIIQALFRLAEISGSGSILVDGVDISTIGLHDLREKLAIIPQEPMLFSGTMRKNLDPFDEYSDAILLRALDAVEIISENENPSEYLYRHVAEGGSNFSVGERQLVCLARAIVRNNKVLILDEATANVDVQTDNLIQNTIRRHFKTCTVLTIAHRLNTIIDSDMILVLDAGQLMEYDHPHILLSNKKGYFSKMVGETGKNMTSILRKQAEESYKNRKSQE